MILDRLDEPWQVYRCADCDPELVDEDDEGPVYEKPCFIAVPKTDSMPNFCPQCGSYLSLCDDDVVRLEKVT